MACCYHAVIMLLFATLLGSANTLCLAAENRPRLADLVTQHAIAGDSELAVAIRYYRASGQFSSPENVYQQAFMQQQQRLQQQLSLVQQEHGDWLLQTLQLRPQEMAEFADWVADKRFSPAALNMRALYLAALFQRAADALQQQQFSFREALLPRLTLYYPCQLLTQHADLALDAFALDSRAAALALAGLDRRLAFDCPQPLTTGRPAQAGYLQRYVAAVELASGRGLQDLIHSRLQTRATVDEAPAGADAFPSFEPQPLMSQLASQPEPQARLLYALMLHVYQPQRRDEIVTLLSELRQQMDQQWPLAQYPREVLAANKRLISGPYDGSDQRMLQYLVSLALASGPGFVIPCGVVLQAPFLLRAEAPLFGSTYDVSLPRSDCRLTDYPLPPSVTQYLTLTEQPIADWLNNHQGSIRHAHAKSRAIARKKLQLFPGLLPALSEKSGYPFASWSLLNLTNRALFNRIAASYDQALADLAQHYQRYFNVPQKRAAATARAALWSVVEEGHWGQPGAHGLRDWLVSDISDRQIIERLAGVQDIAELPQSRISMRYYAGYWWLLGQPDSLLMMAVQRPAVLQALLAKKNSATALTQGTERNNPSTDIHYANAIGKTALHVAVQMNQLQSVRLLLDAGADINARVEGNDRTPLRHSQRSVAMYAAANGELALIRLLQQRGVSFAVRDSAGLSPLHYLLGSRYLPMNPHLNADNYRDYLALIAPQFLHSGQSTITPGFNCARAGNDVEQRLCDDSGLAAYDRQLSWRYRQARSQAVTEQDKKQLKQRQLSWLRQRNQCRDNDCITRAYQQRLTEI